MEKLSAVFWLCVFFIFAMVLAFLQPVIVPLSLIAALLGRGKFRQWGINCWEGEDNKASAQLGGDPDESISSRLGKARIRLSGWSFVADRVDLVAAQLFNHDRHCDRSIERNEGVKQVTTY